MSTHKRSTSKISAAVMAAFQASLGAPLVDPLFEPRPEAVIDKPTSLKAFRPPKRSGYRPTGGADCANIRPRGFTRGSKH